MHKKGNTQTCELSYSSKQAFPKTLKNWILFLLEMLLELSHFIGLYQLNNTWIFL
jgi:hypothetical protein